MSTTKRKKNYYFDKAAIYASLVKYRAVCAAAAAAGKDRPKVPNDIASAIVELSTSIARRANFINYPFKDEMILDGIENGIRAVSSFDPEKSKNPFWYFSLSIMRAFIRRIYVEKKELYVKFIMTRNAQAVGEMYSTQDGKVTDGSIEAGDVVTTKESSVKIDEFIHKFEKSVRERREARLTLIKK